MNTLFKIIITKLFNVWTTHYVICPYIKNEAKFMKKGVKPFSAFSDSDVFLQDYIYA